MEEQRVHRTLSADGTEIAGRVHGRGPALVFVHGIIGDGGLDWGPSVELLTDRFTCYLMSTRGRDLSSDSPDHARHLLVQDVVAFTDSIGEPVGLIGYSSGGALAIAAATQTEAVGAVAAYEPAFTDLLDDEERSVFGAGVADAGEAVSQGRQADANRAFGKVVGNDEEFAMLEASGYFEAAAPCAPAMVQDIIQGQQLQGPAVSDPTVLAGVTVPLLLLHGPRTAMSWFSRNVRHAAEHVADARTREIPGVGHCAPMLQPEAVAAELETFFEHAHQQA